MQFRLRNFKRNIMKLLLNAMLPENPLLLLNLCCPRLIKYWMMFPFKLVGEMNIFLKMSKNCLKLWSMIFLIRAML